MHRLKKHAPLLLALSFLLVNPTPAAEHEPLPQTVRKALKTAGIPLQAASIVVQEVNAASAHLQLNAEQAFNPASLMKLLTTSAALDLLGPAYTWKTEIWTNAPVQNGILKGDLILKGSGDPKLTHEQLWHLLRQLRARGIREIHGNVLLDRSTFRTSLNNADAPVADTSLAILDDKPLRPYNVSPDALLLNFKTIHLRLQTEQKTVLVSSELLPATLSLDNQLNTSAVSCENWKEGLHAEIKPNAAHGNNPPHFILKLSGNYPIECGEKIWHLAVLNHTQYLDGVFRQIWTELGGHLSGESRDGLIPIDARRLASVESPSLTEIIRNINKYSNNVMARQVFLTLGTAPAAEIIMLTEPLPNHMTNTMLAKAKIQRWLSNQAFDFPELVLDNGSGLSRHERISAKHLAHLLIARWNSPLMPEFLASLPLVAIDGTMKKRLKQDPIAGQAHIKTGSLDNVKSIAGYVRDKNGRWQVIVFIVNHPHAQAAQAAQDALLQWVYIGKAKDIPHQSKKKMPVFQPAFELH